MATSEIRNIVPLRGNLCQNTGCWYYRYPHHMDARIMCLRKGKGLCQVVKGDNRYHTIMGAKKCFGVCPSDTAIALTDLDAGVEIAGSKRVRRVSINEFSTALRNILQADELLSGMQISNPAAGARQAFFKFTLRKPVDFAIASVAAVGTLNNGVCQEVKIALGDVAPTPLRALKAEEVIRGKAISEKMN